MVSNNVGELGFITKVTSRNAMQLNVYSIIWLLHRICTNFQLQVNFRVNVDRH